MTYRLGIVERYRKRYGFRGRPERGFQQGAPAVRPPLPPVPTEYTPEELEQPFEQQIWGRKPVQPSPVEQVIRPKPIMPTGAEALGALGELGAMAFRTIGAVVTAPFREKGIPQTSPNIEKAVWSFLPGGKEYQKYVEWQDPRIFPWQDILVDAYRITRVGQGASEQEIKKELDSGVKKYLMEEGSKTPLIGQGIGVKELAENAPFIADAVITAGLKVVPQAFRAIEKGVAKVVPLAREAIVSEVGAIGKWITPTMEKNLKTLGFVDEEISKMTAKQASRALLGEIEPQILKAELAKISQPVVKPSEITPPTIEKPVIPEITRPFTEEIWNKMTAQERGLLAKEAGVGTSRTIAFWGSKTWGQLKEVEKNMLSKALPQAKVGIPIKPTGIAPELKPMPLKGVPPTKLPPAEKVIPPGEVPPTEPPTPTPTAITPLGGVPSVKPLESLPTIERTMWDVTKRFVGKPEKVIEKPIIKQITQLLDPTRIARNPVLQAKILQGRLKDAAEGFTTVALRPVRTLGKPRVKGNIVTDIRIKPKPTAPQVKGKPSMNIHDIAEYAERYDMPPKLRAYFDEIRNVSKRATAMLEKELAKYDVVLNKLGGESDWVYLHRVVEKIGEIENLRMLSWRSATKPRSLDLAGVGEKLPKPVKYLDDPIKELEYQIRGAYDRIIDLRVKEALKAITVTAKERVKPEIIDDLVNKNNIRIAADHLKKLIPRAKRGEVLPGVSLNAVDRVFPEIGTKLRQALEISMPDFKRSIGRIADEAFESAKITRQKFYDALEMARIKRNIEKPLGMGIPLSEKNITAGEITATLKNLNVDTKLSMKMLAEIYQNTYLLANSERRAILTSLSKQATQVLTAAKDEFWAAKSIYQRALKEAGPTIEEGTTRYFGGRIFTTQELIQPGKGFAYKFDPKGFRFIPTAKEGKVILGRDLALEVEKQFGYRVPGVTEKVVEKLGVVGGVLRETKASLDFSVQFIQTQVGGLGLDTWNLLSGRPSAYWIKGTLRGWQAGVAPKAAGRWGAKEEIMAATNEAIGHRVLVQPSEYTESIGVLSRLLRATKVGRPLAFLYERANAAFTAGRIAVGTYSWIGERQIATKGLAGEALLQRLDEVGMRINKATGVLSTRGMGIPAAQRALESVFMFAPRYTRGVIASVLDIGRGGYTGAQARECLLGLMAAATAFFTFIPMALGQKPRLNPLPESMGGDGAKWLTVKVGDSYIGVGGTVYGLARLLANNWAVMTEHPEDLFVFNVTHPEQWMQDPTIRFIRGKFGPPISLGVDYVTGRGYLGNLTRENWTQVMGTALEWLLPIWVESTVGDDWFERLSQKEPLATHPEAALPEFLGMRTIPETEYDTFMALRDTYALRDYGIRYRDIEDSADRDALFRYHTDLKELSDKVSKEFDERGDVFQRFYTVLVRQTNEDRNKTMESVATSFVDGQISMNEYDSVRTYTRTYYSGYKAALWKAREKFDERTVEAIEKYGEDQSPNDKALDKYQEIRGTPKALPTGLPDWDQREKDLTSFLASLPPSVKEYVVTHKDDYIYNYSPNTQKVERLIVEAETGIDAYYRVTARLGLTESQARLAYRKQNPEVDAKLFILGRVTTLQSQQAMSLVASLAGKYGIRMGIPREVGKAIPKETETTGVTPVTPPTSGLGIIERYRARK